MEELIQETDRVGHILRGWKWLDLCLCEDWKHDFDNPDQFRQHGFSDRMYLALSKRYGTNAQNGYFFSCADILPDLGKPHEPCVIVLTSLHCHGQIFGYCATMYDDPEQIELGEQYVGWCEAVANGLHLFQKRLYIDHVHQQMEAFTTIDPITGLLNRRGIMEKLPDALHQLRKQTLVYRMLLISWLTESENAAYDTAGIAANAIKRMPSGQLHTRISDNLFAVLLSEENEHALAQAAEKYITGLEMEMRGLLPDQTQLPRLITESAELNGKKPAELEITLKQLLTDFEEKRSITASHYATHKELLYRLRRDILSQPQLDWNIPAISKNLGISKSHLQRLYREFFSTSIKDEIISARMNKAMQLLRHTDFKVQEIAEHCGYNNENHFMRQFKEKFGVTALQYRKNPMQK
jgi:AraC-like DNA-binding protein